MKQSLPPRSGLSVFSNLTWMVLTVVFAPVAVGAESEFDRQFKLLREQREKQISTALQPINHRYAESLELLLRRATQAGQLEIALEIKKELQTLREGQATSKVAALMGTWRATYSNGGGTNDWTLSADGKIKSALDAGTWTIEGSYLMIKWSNGVLHRISTTEHGTTIKGEWKLGGTVWSPFTADRQK